MKNHFSNVINETIKLKKKLKNNKFEKKVNEAISQIYKTLKSGNKILICGNGGSAADAQHLAAEFMVRLRPKVNRKPLPVISLAMDTSTITACGNDYGYKYLFERNFNALSKNGDLLIAISTSGNSENIVRVLKASKKKKIYSISFLGKNKGKVKGLSNLELNVPSKITARIQECHIFLGHYIFEQVENILFFKKSI
tara:strand:+ start:226 stop:816 length:591 start_codon:yes stop_codon:yes gene_type:complete